MKPHKVILKVAYTVVGLSIIAMVGLTVYQQQQIKKTGKIGAPAESNAIGTNPAIDISHQHGDTTQEEPDSEATDTPDNSYAALFKELKLSSEKQKTLESLLADLQIERRDLSMEMLDTSIQDEERKEIEQLLETLETESNDKVLLILGTDDYEKYLKYTERLNERTLVTTFFRSLPPDERLTETREQAFIDGMFEERKRVEAARPDDKEVTSSADLGIQISRVMETTNQIHSGYIEVADMYLSPSQNEQFKDFLNQRRDMMEVSLNMMRQIFGSDPASNQSTGEPDSTTKR